MSNNNKSTIASRPNPYVGPRSYRKGETLYGREQETSELLDLLIAERIVMLYSPSGAGKSSLLNASVLPKMEENGFHVLPVMRVNMEPPADAAQEPRFNRYIYSLLSSIEEVIPGEKRFQPSELLSMRLKEYLQRYRERAGEMDPNYDIQRSLLLVVDQGEEIITIDPNNRQAKQEFFVQLGEALRDHSVWLLYSLREDYIARFDSYLRPIPTGFGTRYRLRLLQATPALTCVRGPAQQQGVSFAEEAAQKLVDDLRVMRVQQQDGTSVEQLGSYVEPVQLQVVCRRLWSGIDRETDEISAEDLAAIGDVDTALADYYALQVASIAIKLNVREREIREWFDRKLITKQGIRGQVLLAPGKSDGLDNRVIQELETTYLVRSEKRGGSTWFELAHDRLITPVRNNNAAWFDANLSILQRAADVWEQQGRSEGMLLFGKDFLQAQLWAKKNIDMLTLVEQDFLAACLKYHLHQMRERNTNRVVRVLLVASLVMLVLAIFMFFRAERAEKRAVAYGLSAASLNNLTLNPEVSVKLALSSLEVVAPMSADNVAALHRALPAIREKYRFQTHTGKVHVAQFSPDDRLIYSSGTDGLFKVWDVVSGEELQSITVFENPGDEGVTTMAIRPDGKFVALSVESGDVVVVDTTSWKISRTIHAHQGVTWGLAYSPDGKLLATGSSDHTVKLWNADTGELIVKWGVEGCTSADCGTNIHHGWINSVAFSPDGKWLVSGGGLRSEATDILVWDVEQRAYAFDFGSYKKHTSEIQSVAFSPDGKRLVTAAADRLIKVWSMETRQWVMDITGHTDWVFSAEFTPDGSQIISAGSDRTVRLWDTLYGRPVMTLLGHSNQVFDAMPSEDGRYIVSASEDKTVRVWDTSRAGNMEILSIDSSNKGRNRVYAMDYSPDGRLLASTGLDAIIRVWALADPGKPLAEIKGHGQGVEGVLWLDENSLVSASRDTTASVWDALSGTEKFVFREHKSAIFALALSADHSLAATGDLDGAIYVWDTKSGAISRQWKDEQGEGIFSLAFSPDQSWLVSGHTDGWLYLWNLKTGQQVASLQGHGDTVQSLAFNQDGRYVASVSDDGQMILWDISQGQLTQVSATPAHSGAIFAVTFAEADRYLLTAGADSLVNVWNATNVQEPLFMYSLYGHTDRVYAISQNPKNDQIATTSADGTVRVFTMNTDELVEHAKTRLGRWKVDQEFVCYEYFKMTCQQFYDPTLWDWLMHILIGSNN